MSSFGKVSQPFCTDIPCANLGYFSKISKFETWFPDFSDYKSNKCVLGPGDVFACFLCPRIYRFVYHIENVPQTLSDTLYKFFLCMFPSIWHYPFFKNHLKNRNNFERGIGQIGFLFNWIAYWAGVCWCRVTSPGCQSSARSPKLSWGLPESPPRVQVEWVLVKLQ